MCGVLGAIGPSAPQLRINFESALDLLSHRGPDDRGLQELESHNLLLGHRRLAILDLSSAGHQPMNSGDHWLIFNGEIYNHLELRQKYLGHVTFASSSDTETLLQLLILKSTQAFDELSGMFAGAWYDTRERKLVIFRDSLGIKPLFIRTCADGSLMFASEIKALLRLENRSPLAINPGALKAYLSFENYPQGETLFADIRSLQPGEILIAHNNHSLTVLKEFMNPQALNTSTPFATSKTDIETDIEKALMDAVESHLLSDVPLGVYLSGGIDSSLVASMAAGKTQHLLGFTGYFQTTEKHTDEHYDERPLARLVAKKAGIPLHEVLITPAHFLSYFDSLIYHLDEPRMGMGSFSQYVVAKEASQHRKIILAGHGGDELFAGYPLHKTLWLLSYWKTKEFWLQLFKLKSKEWPWLVYTFARRFISAKVFFAPRIWPQPSSFDSAFSTTDSKALLSRLDAYYKSVYVQGLLDVEDRISMAFGLETRVPLWSQQLRQISDRIPMSVKLTEGQLKYLLKKIAVRWLPTPLLSAPKRGFPTPLRHWFKQELKEFITERLLSSTHEEFYKVLPKKELRRLLKSQERWPLPFALDELRAHKIWTALCLESWMRQNNVVIENKL